MPLATYHFNEGPLAAAGTVPAAAHSLVYVCTTCGKLWARINCERALWYVCSAPCELHTPIGVQDWLCVPGSLILPGVYVASDWCAAAKPEYLPPALWARELDVHLKHLQRKLEND